MSVCVQIQQGKGSRAWGSDGNGCSIFRPPTLECRVRERHNTAIHSLRTILSPVCEVDPSRPSFLPSLGAVERVWMDGWTWCLLRYGAGWRGCVEGFRERESERERERG